MLKRNIPILVLFLGMTTMTVAQTGDNRKVSEVQTIEQLQSTNPTEYKEVVAYAEKHGSQIMDLPKGKDARLNGEISMEKAQLIDPLKMGLTVPSANEYYRITGTDKMLLLKSLYVLQQEMKTNRK